MAQRTPLQRVRVGLEANGVYAIDLTDTIGDLTDVRFSSATLVRSDEVLQSGAVVQRMHQRRAIRHGFKRATIDMSGDLVPLAAELSSGATPGTDSLATMLGAMLGGRAGSNAGSAIAGSGASTTVLPVTGGHGTRFPAGQLIVVETTASSERFELARVASVSTDNVTLAWALSFTPADTAKVLNSDMVFFGDVLPSAATYLQFLVEGEDRDDIYLAMGAQGALALEWPLGGLPMWSSQFQASKWMHDDELTTPQGGAALAIATLPGGSPVPITAGSIVLAPSGGTTRVLPTIAEIAFTLGVSWQPVDSYNGVEGRAQMAFVRGEQPQCTMLVLADNESWSDVYAAGTTYRIACQAGNLGAGTVAIEYPLVELIAEPTKEDKNGLSYWRLTWGAFEDSTSTDQTTEVRRSPVRIARF